MTIPADLAPSADASGDLPHRYRAGMVEYLFDLDAVEAALADLPALRRELGEFSHEGVPSRGFPPGGRGDTG